MAQGPTILLDETEVRIPGDLLDLAAFRRWAQSDAFPEKVRIDWIGARSGDWERVGLRRRIVYWRGRLHQRPVNRPGGRARVHFDSGVRARESVAARMPAKPKQLEPLVNMRAHRV